jgi:acetoin utilization deacetylase AcuC-like enzyme
MHVPVYTHPVMAEHRPGPGHPERPERLTAVLAALERLGLDRREARPATREELERVHPAAFVDALFEVAPGEGTAALDPDTLMSPASLEAALRAAGACVQAVEAVARGETDRAFCAVRPPGHHAEPGRAMGFCMFSSVAVAARAAQAAGLARVAVVDFDVHHGNGTQAAFEADPSLFYASIHQSPLYPGTGAESETGVGNVVNAPVPPHAPRELWRRLFETRLMPAMAGFAPDLVIVSAGFDAHRRDPLANQSLEAEDFAWATRAVVEAAGGAARGRVVSSLEGGYDLEALGRSAAAHVEALAQG